jgi:hypothetical protein
LRPGFLCGGATQDLVDLAEGRPAIPAPSDLREALLETGGKCRVIVLPVAPDRFAQIPTPGFGSRRGLAGLDPSFRDDLQRAII